MAQINGKVKQVEKIKNACCRSCMETADEVDMRLQSLELLYNHLDLLTRHQDEKVDYSELSVITDALFLSIQDIKKILGRKPEVLKDVK